MNRQQTLIRLAVLGLLLALVVGPAQAQGPLSRSQTTTITFEETIPQPQVVRNQYCNNTATNKGVEFLEPVRIFAPTVQTASPTHAVINEFPSMEFDEVKTVKVRFTTSQSQVSMKVGLDRYYPFQVTATLYAYSSDTPGTGFINYATTYRGYGPTPITQTLSLSSAAGDIRSVEIDFTGPSSGNYAFEVVDDLTFSSVGPTCTGADTTDPTVQITKPISAGQTFYNPNIELAFKASDSGTGVAKVQVSFLDASSSELSSFYVCGGSGVPPCPVPSNNLSYDFYTYLPLNTATIRVKAWDFAGNSGQAERSLTLTWFGNSFNLWAMAMEITQGIQSWLPTSTQHTAVITPTFTYPAAPTAVPLVAGRTTIVRVYAGVENTVSGVPVTKARAWLRCYTDAAFSISCSGPTKLSPKNQPPQIPREITVRPGDSLDTKRRDTRLSWNFELPGAWIQAGRIYLEAEVAPPTGVTECGTCYDAANRIRVSQVDFNTVPNFTNNLVHLVRISRQLSGTTTAPTQAQINAPTDFFRKTYPVDEASVSSTPNATWTLNDCGNNCDPDPQKNLDVRCGRVTGLLANSFPNKANKMAVLAVIDTGYPCSGRGGGGYAYTNAGAPAKTGGEEVGHAVGLSHAGPPPGHGAECQAASGGCDNDWPWPHGTTGAFGFDILNWTVQPPGTTEADLHDFMSYGSPNWVSPRNWIRVYNAFTNSNLAYPKSGQQSSAGGELKASVAPEIAPTTALTATSSYLLVRGEFDEDAGWTLRPAYELQFPQGSHDDLGEGDYTIELLNALEQVVSVRHFSLPPGHIDTDDPETVLIPPPSFVEILPLPEGVETIALRTVTETLAVVSRSANVPSVEILSPTADGFEGQPDNPIIRWQGRDADENPLYYMVQYSPAASGRQEPDWQTLASDLTAEELPISLADLPGGSIAMVRVLASDGFNTGVATSPNFVVTGKPPRAEILAPSDGTIIGEGDRIVLRGTAWDLEDGLLNPGDLSWYSDRDGLLGTGRRLEVTTLSPGTHEVTLQAQDSDGQFGTAVIAIQVTERVNTQPTADAGPDQNMSAGDTILLDGTPSGDPDGDALTYHWALVSKPAGSSPWLTDPGAPDPGFFAGHAGDYELELTVHDGQVGSLPDRVTVHVTGSAVGSCPDFDDDDQVTAADLQMAANAWRSTDTTYDLNRDDLVTVLDLMLVARAWGDCILPPTPEEDPFNRIYQVTMDEYGQGSGFEMSVIPEDAFWEETIDPVPKEDDVVPDPPQRIHPVLAQMIAEDPTAVKPVIILLEEDVQIPRFPDLPDGVRRDSPDGEPFAAQAQELINVLLTQRSASTQEFVAAAAELGVELRVVEQFWLINGFLTEIQLSQVESLLNISQLAYIQPRFAGEEPPQDGNANNDVADGRFRIVSDPYFNLNLTNGYIGLLDTGIRTTHVLFNNPSHVDYIRDCVNGGKYCNNTNANGWNPNDSFWNHGTSSAAIIVGNNRLGDAYRGVTAITLDSWQIYDNGGLDTAAAVRAFQRAVAVLDRVIVGEIQASEGENGAIALAADNAYNAGAVIVAANGNFGPNAKTVRSPGLAHKAIGVGAYNVVSQAQYNNQGRGAAPDGRYKPDLQAPTDSETASNGGNNALHVFTGTSGATPYAAGAAALMRNWLRQYKTWDNGHVYAHLMNSGTLSWPNYDNTRGLGQLRMPVNGVVWWGKVSVNQGTVINIPINIPSNRRDLRASLWWPEARTEKHDDIDVHLIDPSGVEQAKGYSGVSIFERAQVPGSLAAGTWKVRIKGYNVKSGPQTVYWVVDVHN
jgi:hypothetical protein